MDYSPSESLSLVKVAHRDGTHHFDIVFVHGLGGDALNTWRNKETDGFWPEWIAEDFESTQVWSLNYPAPQTQWTESNRRAMALPDRALGVLELMAAEGLGKRSLIFVTHSLGGLLVKQVLRESEDHPDPNIQAIADFTKAVLFLATPHSGSNLSNLAKAIASLRLPGVPLRLGFLARLSPAIKDLEKNCTHLRRLSRSFRSQSAKRGIKSYAYAEMEPIGPLLVVEQSSADPGVPGCTLIPIGANHFDIAKPASRETELYKFVSRAIRELVTEHINDNETISDEPTPTMTPVSDLSAEFRALINLSGNGDPTSAMKGLRESIQNRFRRLMRKHDLDFDETSPGNNLRALKDAALLSRMSLASLEVAIDITAGILYEEPPSATEAENAIQLAATGLSEIDSAQPDDPHFEIRRDKAGEYRANFIVDKATLLHAEPTMTVTSAQNTVNAIIRSLGWGDRQSGRGINRKTTKDGRHYCLIIGANGQMLARSKFCNSENSLDELIEAVKQLAPASPVLDG